MSSIIATIKDAMKDAMRSKDKPRLQAIRSIQSEFKRVEVDERIAIDNERALVIMDKMLKQRRDSISQFEAAERYDLVDVEKAEVLVIQEFLPAQLSEAEVSQLIDDAIATTGASSMQDMGSVMAIIKPQIQGRADAGSVSKLIKTKFA
jgi:hypothetical protein